MIQFGFKNKVNFGVIMTFLVPEGTLKYQKAITARPQEKGQIEMPWISAEMCTGCEACVDECSVGAISMEEDIAFIDEKKCIRCAVCHDACPDDAVRHDGERIPEEVESNLAWVKELLEHEHYLHDRQRQKDLIQRLKRYFAKNKKVMEETIERLNVLQTEYAD